LTAVALKQVSNSTQVIVCEERLDMTTLEVTLDLPDRMAREAQAAGLLTPHALRGLIKDAMQRRAAQSLLTGAARATEAGSKRLSLRDIQTEVKAVRADRRANSTATT